MTFLLVEDARFPLGRSPVGQFFDRGRKFVLVQPFRFVEGGIDVTVPAWAVSDLNSTPRLVWTIFPPAHYPAAAITHDWGYAHPAGYPRKWWDQVHQRLMAIDGGNVALRQSAYRMLRWFGGGAWDRHRRAELPR